MAPLPVVPLGQMVLGEKETSKDPLVHPGDSHITKNFRHEKAGGTEAYFPYISRKTYSLYRWGFLHFRYLKCLVWRHMLSFLWVQKTNKTSKVKKGMTRVPWWSDLILSFKVRIHPKDGHEYQWIESCNTTNQSYSHFFGFPISYLVCGVFVASIHPHQPEQWKKWLVSGM